MSADRMHVCGEPVLCVHCVCVASALHVFAHACVCMAQGCGCRVPAVASATNPTPLGEQCSAMGHRGHRQSLGQSSCLAMCRA